MQLQIQYNTIQYYIYTYIYLYIEAFPLRISGVDKAI